MANYNQPWNPGSTFQSPYMSQMSPYQTNVQPYQGIASTIPQMQSPVPAALSGKTVNSPQEILPQDIPMNGFTSYFPKADGSEIYAKCWNSNGTIDTRTYILKPIEEPKSEEPDIMSQILSRLESIEHKVSYKPRYNGPKKEEKTNG